MDSEHRSQILAAVLLVEIYNCYNTPIMKIIFLNTWNAEIPQALQKFLQSHLSDTDIFCFQEAGHKMKQLAQTILPDHTALEEQKPMSDTEKYYQAIYLKKALPLHSSGQLLADEPECGIIQYCQVTFQGKKVTICNLHGNPRPGTKLDNPAMLRQSEAVIEFLKDMKGTKIIGGDFNLLPETQSIRLFEQNGYVDLIKKYQIPTTRNQIAWEKYPNNKQYYSDYTFVSPEIEVRKFEVPDMEISDHLPLILEILPPT